jgi:hypothetical protein
MMKGQTWALVPMTRYAPADEQPIWSTMQHRLFGQVLEAVRALEACLWTSREGDVGAILAQGLCALLMAVLMA